MVTMEDPNCSSDPSVLESKSSSLCSVSVHAPMGSRLFFYEIPAGIGELSPGDAVLVPFGAREIVGWVIQVNVSQSETEMPARIKPILERIEAAGLATDELKLCQTLQNYYGTNFSDILALFVPPAAPKIVRFVERIPATDESPSVPASEFFPPCKGGKEGGELNLSLTARQIARQIDEAGGRLDVRKARTSASPFPQAVLKTALRELVSTGWFTLRSSVVATRPGQKKFIGPTAIESLPPLTETHQKILELVKKHPFQFGAAELAKLAHARLGDVRSLVSGRLVTEHTSRRWRTPMERSARMDRELSPILNATPSQARAISELTRALDAGAPEFFLLYGPTASGKTFVYEAAARHALAHGRQVLLMVPEIALTKPLIDRIQDTIREPIAVVHSRQTAAERRDEWHRASTGEARLLVGPRSAAFVPLPDLGLAIIDECHDAGYKQSESPYLDARKVVEEKCKLKNAALVIGSATPTVEQLYEKSFHRLDLTEFPTRPNRPQVTVIDLRKTGRPNSESKSSNTQYFMTPELQKFLDDTLARKESAVLLLNRRGFAPEVMCPSCGYAARCEACLVGMTYHADRRQIICHSCGLTLNPPSACPDCRYTPLGYIGVGTERIEEVCRAKYPGAKIARLDQDVLRKSRKEAFGILKDLKDGKIDILVGTQMIAKGLDVPKVTLAAVVFADVGLNMPDYRSRERTFQLLAQLIGRSGRHSSQGRAVLQTFQPDNLAVVCSLQENVRRFYEDELEQRRRGNWPPFSRLVRILVQSQNAPKALQQARQIYEFVSANRTDLKSEIRNPKSEILISPPLPAPRPKWNGEYRFQLLMRLRPGSAPPVELFEDIKTKHRQTGVKVVIEPDPISIL